MKNICKHIVAITILGIGFCSTFLMANPMSSYLAQDDLRSKVLDLLKNNDLDQLQEYLASIPDCNASFEGEGNVNNCTVDRTNGKSFLWHVWQKGASRERLRYTLVELDAGLYDGLSNLYRSLYHAEPREFNANYYRDFYNRFKNTWLKERVELIVTNLWQPGTIYRKWDGFSAMTGKNIYTTLYVSYMLNFGNITKYVDPEIKLDKYIYGGGRDRLRTILREMKQKSDETNTPELLRYIKLLWYHSISHNENDQAEKDYYQGKKYIRKYEMFNEEGWAMFADMFDGLSGETLRREKHNIKVDIWNCMRIINNAETCDAFEQGAIKYGFYTPPIEVTEPSIEEQMQEIQDQINEKLFMFK